MEWCWKGVAKGASSGEADLNHRPKDFCSSHLQSSALPTELSPDDLATVAAPPILPPMVTTSTAVHTSSGKPTGALRALCTGHTHWVMRRTAWAVPGWMLVVVGSEVQCGAGGG